MNVENEIFSDLFIIYIENIKLNIKHKNIYKTEQLQTAGLFSSMGANPSIETDDSLSPAHIGIGEILSKRRFLLSVSIKRDFRLTKKTASKRSGAIYESRAVAEKDFFKSVKIVVKPRYLKMF